MKCSCTHVCVYPLLEDTLNVCGEGFGWGALAGTPPRKIQTLEEQRMTPSPLCLFGVQKDMFQPLC